MKQRLTLADLASVFAELTGESKKASSDFLREFFALVASALEGGESVRIKGFGTFKLTEVDSRKSVNVATGAEMEIPGHRKVSFVPGRELADAVNEAFEMFEPVELSERVTDDMLDSTEEEEPEVEVEEQVAPTSAQEVLEEAFEEVKTESPEELNEEFDEAVEREEIRERNEAIEHAEDRIIEEEGIEEEVESPAEDEEISEESRPRRRFGWGFLVGFLTAAVVAVIAMVFFFDWRPWLALDKSPENIAFSDASIVNSDTLSVPVPTEIVKDSIAATAEDSLSVSGSKVVPTRPSDTVRYDTITKTRYLTTMSREYYGNYHFWPYIYEENKAILGHPDRIRPGTQVVVPELSKYGVDPKNPADVEKAKRKGTEIYSRYR